MPTVSAINPDHNSIIRVKTLTLKLLRNFSRPLLRIDMLDCVQREGLAGYGSKKEKCNPNSVLMYINCQEEPISASLVTETAQKCAVQKPANHLFSTKLPPKTAHVCAVSPTNTPQNAPTHLRKLEKYQTKPFTAHGQGLSDEKQKT
jgi:hypothetical protein